jgi:hypothetical protein
MTDAQTVRLMERMAKAAKGRSRREVSVSCGANGPWASTEEEAAERWNARGALEQAAREMVAVCHFSPCDGSQIEARDKLEALLGK